MLGCDDTAKSEFLNKRKAKGKVAAPQSQSNLWFVEPEQLDHLGPVIGRGAVWLNDRVAGGEASDAYLFSGFERRAAHLHADPGATFTFEVDVAGDGTWTELQSVPVDGYAWVEFLEGAAGTWIRVRPSADQEKATVWFTYANADTRGKAAAAKFTGIATAGTTEISGGIVRARGDNRRNLHFASDAGLYHLDPDMQLRAVDDAQELAWLREHAAVPDRRGVIELDTASVIYIDDEGRRFRLPKGNPTFDRPGPLGWGRFAVKSPPSATCSTATAPSTSCRPKTRRFRARAPGRNPQPADQRLLQLPRLDGDFGDRPNRVAPGDRQPAPHPLRRRQDRPLGRRDRRHLGARQASWRRSRRGRIRRSKQARPATHIS